MKRQSLRNYSIRHFNAIGLVSGVLQLQVRRKVINRVAMEETARAIYANQLATIAWALTQQVEFLFKGVERQARSFCCLVWISPCERGKDFDTLFPFMAPTRDSSSSYAFWTVSHLNIVCLSWLIVVCNVIFGFLVDHGLWENGKNETCTLKSHSKYAQGYFSFLFGRSANSSCATCRCDFCDKLYGAWQAAAHFMFLPRQHLTLI